MRVPISLELSIPFVPRERPDNKYTSRQRYRNCPVVLEAGLDAYHIFIPNEQGHRK